MIRSEMDSECIPSERTCDQNRNLKFNGKPFFDGGLTCVVNLRGNLEQFDSEARILMEYLRGGAAQKTGLTAELEQKVEEVNQHLEWRQKLMEMETYYDRVVRNTAYAAKRETERGMMERIRREKKEMVLALLRDNVSETTILNASHLTKEELDEIKKSVH